MKSDLFDRVRGRMLCERLGKQIADFTPEQWLEQALWHEFRMKEIGPHDPNFQRNAERRDMCMEAGALVERQPGVFYR